MHPGKEESPLNKTQLPSLRLIWKNLPHKYLEEVKQRLFADSGGQRWENGRQSMAGEKMDKVKLGEGEMDGVAFQHLDD